MDTKTLTALDFAKPPADFLHFLVTCILLACLWNKYNHCHLLLNKQPSELLSDGSDQNPETEARTNNAQCTVQVLYSREIGRSHTGVSGNLFSFCNLVQNT